MSEFLRQFTEFSNNYSRSHNALVGPFTADGKSRLQESLALTTFGQSTSEKLRELSKGMGEKNIPIGLKIENRTADLEYLKTKQEELRGPEKQHAHQAPEPHAQPAMSL